MMSDECRHSSLIIHHSSFLFTTFQAALSSSVKKC